MQETKFVNRPGCFGFAATFSVDGVCKTCSASVECQEEAHSAVISMREARVEAAKLLAQHRMFRAEKGKETASLSVEFMVTPPIRQAPRIVSLSESQKVAVAALPVKAQPEYRKILERGIPFKQELQSGQNPIRNSGGRPAYLEFICDLLLRGPVDKKSMRSAMIERFGWTYGTANSHVTIVSSLLPALGVQEENGSFAL